MSTALEKKTIIVLVYVPRCYEMFVRFKLGEAG